MNAAARPFGVTRRGEPVTAYTLTNAAGMTVTVLDYGATIQSIRLPGGLDVVLGYDTVEGYERGDSCHGATIGRVANRLGYASFSLGGRTYPLAKNCGQHHLHGGVEGFHRKLWQAETGAGEVTLSRLSPDGEEGYPGDLAVSVTFRLTEDNALHLGYWAQSDRDTLVNLTNHSFFNLAGGGSALGHGIQVFAERITESDGECLPTGRLLDVAGTPFDLRAEKEVGQAMPAGGFDHNFVLSGRRAAVLRCRETGLAMEVETTMPGMQLYTANHLTGEPGKGGAPMERWGAVCLETQLFPDGMRHHGFPSPVLRAGEEMRSETVFRFTG